MKVRDIESLLSQIIPNLYAFAYALIPDELQAEQLIIDAYSVFLVSDKDFIEGYEFDPTSKRDRVEIKKYLLLGVLSEVYRLGLKRSAQLESSECHEDYMGFYSLEISIRACLFLKERENFSDLDIQEVLTMQRHQVLERLYQGRRTLAMSLDSKNAVTNEL